MSVPPPRATRRARRREFRLRPLGVGELLDEALALYRGNAKLFLSLILIPAVVWALASTVVNSSLVYSIFLPTTPSAPLPGLASFETFAVVYLCSTPILFLCWAYQQAVLTGAISTCYLGQETTARAIRARLKGFVVRVIGAYVLSGLIVAGAGAVLVVVPVSVMAAAGPSSPAAAVGILGMCCGCPILLVFLILFEFVAAALVSENLSATAAIARSFRLVFSDFWRVLWVTIIVAIVTGILAAIVNVAIQLPFSIVGLTDPLGAGSIATTPLTITGRAVVMLLQSATGALILPFSVAVTVLLYFDIRIRKEGFDVEMLASAMGGSTGPDFVL